MYPINNEKSSPIVKDIERALTRGNLSFSQALFNYIDVKGLTDVEIYTRAHINRRLFSKIRKTGYRPSKETVIALAFALKLNYTETTNLLNLAGFALSTSPSIPFDIIVTNALMNEVHDITEINEILYHYGLPILGE